MPIVRIEMLEGRTPAMKRELSERVVVTVSETLGIAPDRVRVLLYELPPEHWTVGSASPPAPTSNE